ncbi:leucine efflux protein LeuE [Nevskia soli]|uniref:leucine efflux protein LeuE n=1 Tax=Nevskia soli TaxID=418856 RepID=UPI0004A6FFA8|nr:leucine efflux protein LeuE [Nevskia soli]
MSESFFGVIHLPTYLLGTLIIVLLPGPNSLFVLSTAARRGMRAGYRAACGVFIGDTVLMVLASAGVSSLLKAYPALFLALKYAGGAYLAYLGVKLLLAAWKGRLATSAAPAGAAAELPAAEGDPLHRALGISLINPKAILFFIAFFIQFVDPAYGHKALSFALLGLIAQCFSFLYLSALIFSGARLAAAFRRWRRTRTALTGGAGAAFVGFGVKLATASVN